MSKNLVYVGIGILAIIAVFLGYKIYQQQTVLQNQSIASSKPQPIVQQNTSKSSTLSPQNNNISQAIDLDSVFKQFPGRNASKEEKMKFNNYLLSIGTEGGTLTINNCKVVPLVFRVKKGADFMLSNLDNVDHTLKVNQVTFSVKARETKKVKADNLDGANGYYCDGTGPKIGILHVVQ